MTALDTGTEELLAEVDDGVAVITMNRLKPRFVFDSASIGLGRASPPNGGISRCLNRIGGVHETYFRSSAG